MLFSQKSAVDALKCLNIIAIERANNGAYNVSDHSGELMSLIQAVVNTNEVPREQLHLVNLKAAIRCYENGRYAEGAKICRRIVNATPEMYALLAKCSIKVTILSLFLLFHLRTLLWRKARRRGVQSVDIS